MAGCLYPRSKDGQTFGCGQCFTCRKRRQNGWVARLEQHSKVGGTAYFITLTYAPEFVPLSAKGFMTLRYSDVQKFLKRLRKVHAKEKLKNKISYYCAGEYGGRTLRPHYHLIMFGGRLEFIHRAWSLEMGQGRTAMGYIHSGNIDYGSIRYTLKYISKLGKIPAFQGDDRTPEFSHMSKALGKSYLTEQIIQWHRADPNGRFYLPLLGGLGTSLPRYYSHRIWNADERKEISTTIIGDANQRIYSELGQNPEYLANALKAMKYHEQKAAKRNYDEKL